MRLRVLVLHIILTVITASAIYGQEVVTGLQSIPEIRTAWNNRDLNKSGSLPDTLELPFFDDFSPPSVYPDDSLWADNHAYINNTYPIDQVTQGVATLDALDSTGILYSHASSSVFEADHLTSQPINLEGVSGDNFYLSFVYQPGGIADLPEQSDSLTLQFYSPSEDSWFSIWDTEGSDSLHPFKPVIVNITGSKYLQKGFRFRFINYASLGSVNVEDIAMLGNCDHWHLDYILLDRDRNAGDTIMHDVAFTRPLRTTLNNYEAMPWNQFRSWFLTEMGSGLLVHYTNNDNILRNVTRSFTITDVYDDIEVYSSTPGATNVEPGEQISYNIPLVYTYNTTGSDSALFMIKATLKTDDFDPRINDTITYFQVFSNYFSIDDGSTERGYGINGQGSDNAMAVFRYRSYLPDTIRGVSICFNDSYQSANQRSFDIVILEDMNGVPGDIIYTQENVLVDPGKSLNGFITYILDDPVYVDNWFFIGWRQRSETFLNAGIDSNTPHNGRQYYYINGIWNLSEVEGSLMIRPVVGKPLISTGIDHLVNNKNNIKIWPNPARDFLNIEFRNIFLSGETRIIVFDAGGREMISVYNTNRIDIHRLPEGIYLLVVTDNGVRISTNKFIRIN